MKIHEKTMKIHKLKQREEKNEKYRKEYVRYVDKLKRSNVCNWDPKGKRREKAMAVFEQKIAKTWLIDINPLIKESL